AARRVRGAPPRSGRRGPGQWVHARSSPRLGALRAAMGLDRARAARDAARVALAGLTDLRGLAPPLRDPCPRSGMARATGRARRPGPAERRATRALKTLRRPTDKRSGPGTAPWRRLRIASGASPLRSALQPSATRLASSASDPAARSAAEGCAASEASREL